jgi:hypothetical protein
MVTPEGGLQIDRTKTIMVGLSPDSSRPDDHCPSRSDTSTRIEDAARRLWFVASWSRLSTSLDELKDWFRCFHT